MIIQSDSIKLIPVQGDDPEIRRILDDQSLLDNLSETRRYPEAMPLTMTFRIVANETTIGEISLKSLRWYNHKAEISLFIAPEQQGKGYGKQALKALLDYAFYKMNLHRLEAEIMEYNRASVALFESFGFVPEGRLREARFHKGQYTDILRYGLLQREYFARHGETPITV